jgi:hypothetical protein
VKVIKDPDEAAAWVDKLSRSEIVAFDYETDRLKPDHPDARVVSCSVSDGETTIAYPWHGEAIEATKKLLQAPCGKIASNAKFEDRWTKRALGIRVRNWFWDTMQAAHVLDCRPGVTGLKFQAFALLGQEPYDSQVAPYLKSAKEGANEVNRIRDVGLSKLLLYNGLDSLLEFRVAQIQTSEMGVPMP